MTAAAAAWQDVVARLRPFIARRVSPTEIDDVMQDVFVRMQRGLKRVDERPFQRVINHGPAKNLSADHQGSAERKGHILCAAAKWCVYWATRGYGLAPVG